MKFESQSLDEPTVESLQLQQFHRKRDQDLFQFQISFPPCGKCFACHFASLAAILI